MIIKVLTMNIATTRILSLLVLASAVLVTGCATKFERQAFNSEAYTHIKTITVPQWNDEEENRAVVINHPGNSFGLIGLAVAAADTASKTKKLNEAVPAASAKVTSAFYNEALPLLKKMGYQVILVPAKRGDRFDDVKAALEKPQGQDASLQLIIGSGYNAAGASTDYFPAMGIIATLTDSKTNKVIYNDIYQYGYNAGNKDAIFVEAAAECKFKDIEALTVSPDKTRTCLMTGPVLLAKQITSDLKK